MAFDKNNEEWDGSEHDEPWIKWFCGLKGHEMFCEVERSYIEDGFNLYGLRVCVSNFNDCLDLILDRIGPDEESDDSHLTQSACTLYGLIHARYIITAHGLDAMYNKYAAKEFGTCPLIQCGGQPVLPVSLKDEMGVDTVKIYCPKCSQVFHPPPIRSSRSSSTSINNNALTASALGGGGAAGSGVGMITTTIQSGGADGAAFGTTFPHLFLMTFSNLVPDPLPPESVYVPRIFGFRIHKSTAQSQQQRQQQQRFLPSPTTATTTNTSNTQSTLHTTATTTALQPDQQQQQQQQQENVTTTATQSTGGDDYEDAKPAVVNHNQPDTDDRKIAAKDELDGEDRDGNDNDGNDYNSSQFNQQATMAASGMTSIQDSETGITAVPSLLAVHDNNEIITNDDIVANTTKRNRDTNGVPETSALVKRRRRAPNSSNNM